MDQHQFMDISKLLHCGVYALLQRGEVVYVGKSKKPIIRLYTHMYNRGKVMKKSINPDAGPAMNGKGINFDGIWFLPCMLGQIDTLENYFIRKYLPKHNSRGKPVGPIPAEIKELLRQMVVITDLPASRDIPTRGPSGPYMIRRF